jgi:trehalose monomycolate/heme transporter
MWFRLAQAVMKRPVLVAVGVLVPMVLLGVPFLRFEPSFPDYRVLPKSEPGYIANEILDREFDGDQLTPIDVLCEVDGSALSMDNLQRLMKVSAALEQLKQQPGLSPPKLISGLFTLVPGVPTDVLLKKLSTPREELQKLDPTVQMGIDAFARGRFMRFAVLLDNPYNRPESLAVIDAIRKLSVDGVKIQVGGPGAYLLDMKETLVTRSPWMLGLVAVVMFVVLFLVFGSITLPIKAMIMNMLSLSASFGAIVWIFQDGRMTDLLRYEPLGISDCTAPLLMFSIVFGLSMDYEVLILARVREEYDKTGDNDLSVARGLARTGRLITSAALLLVVVIGAFGTSHIIFMKSLGIGMALAVLLDATIIRALLVPAAMKLMGDWNWWAPKPLLALWKKIGLGEGH